MDRHIVQRPRAVYSRPRSAVFTQTVSGSGAVTATSSVPWEPPANSSLTKVVVRVGTADSANATQWVTSKNGTTVVTVTLPAGQVRAEAICFVDFSGTDTIALITPTTTAVGVNVTWIFGTAA